MTALSTPHTTSSDDYPLTFAVDYPDRDEAGSACSAEDTTTASRDSAARDLHARAFDAVRPSRPAQHRLFPFVGTTQDA